MQPTSLSTLCTYHPDLFSTPSLLSQYILYSDFPIFGFLVRLIKLLHWLWLAANSKQRQNTRLWWHHKETVDIAIEGGE